MSVDEAFRSNVRVGADRPEIDPETGAQRLCGVYRLNLRCVSSGFVKVESLVLGDAD